MAEDKEIRTTRTTQADPPEQRGLVTDVIVPVVQSGTDAAIAAGVGAYVGNKLGKPDPPKGD